MARQLPSFRIANGHFLLLACCVIGTANSFVFAASAAMAGPFGPTAILPGALWLNLPATLVAWIALVRGRRRTIAESIATILMISYVHWLLIYNLFSVVALSRPWRI